MSILIKNANLVSMDCNRERVEKGIDILINGDIIKEIGVNLSESNDVTEVIDATNKIVMPGLINTHCHVPMSIFRETVDGYNLQDWLQKKIWPMEDKMENEDVYYASLLSFIEMIKTGCTTVNDMYFMTDYIIKAMKKTGIRLQTTRTLMGIFGEENGDERLKELSRLINDYKNEPQLSFNYGIHGLYTSNDAYIKKCVQHAKENSLPIHMHYCENDKEVEDIIKIYNQKPIDVLINNFADVPVLLAHAVKMSKEDIEKIKDFNISISHCPISNLKLGCGVANIAEMMKNGINISLGTDGQGSGCSLDMFETMKFTALLQKGIKENPEVINSYDVLKMATINGAKALGMQEKTGSIEEGKKADLIIINMDRIKAIPENDLISQIVYNTNGEDVETTIVDGKILMQNYELKLDEIDEKYIFEECEKIIKRIS